jgi:hypothetical protein
VCCLHYNRCAPVFPSPQTSHRSCFSTVFFHWKNHLSSTNLFIPEAKLSIHISELFLGLTMSTDLLRQHLSLLQDSFSKESHTKVVKKKKRRNKPTLATIKPQGDSYFGKAFQNSHLSLESLILYCFYRGNEGYRGERRH